MRLNDASHESFGFRIYYLSEENIISSLTIKYAND